MTESCLVNGQHSFHKFCIVLVHGRLAVSWGGMTKACENELSRRADRRLLLAPWREKVLIVESRQFLYHTRETECTMNKIGQKLDKYVGHLAGGALRFRNELSVGTEAPDFELRILDGATFRLSHYRGKSNVVLIFGSLTCGSTITQLRAGNPPLGSLYRRFKRKGFEFFLVYSVEMHPGEYVPRPKIFEQRLKHAQRLKDEEKAPFPIIVDGIENEVRRLYQALTNPVFVVDRNGVLVYKSSWTWAPDLETALTEMVACERAKTRNEMVRMCYSEKLVGLTRNRRISAQVHRRAGPGAVETFKALLRKQGTKG